MRKFSIKIKLLKSFSTTYIVNVLTTVFTSLTFSAMGNTAAFDDLLPNVDKVDFTYQGAFRFSTEIIGDSRMSYATGPFTISSNGDSLFAVGHVYDQALAEFLIPTLSKTTSPKELAFATPIQKFRQILKYESRIKNPQKNDRITGMEVIEGELFVNAVEYYDAPGDNTDTTFILREANNLASSKVDGFFKLRGRAHAAGWISKLPAKWKTKFSASYLTGYANNYAINLRLSMGPSAFVTYLDNYAGIDESGGMIGNKTLLDYSLKHPLREDLYNTTLKNDVWTDESSAVYGFILPNRDYYLVLGYSGGHKSGMGYKIKQSNGNVCGGPCAKDAGDYYNHYWIYDVNDLVKVQQNKLKPWQPEPIMYGELNLPFQPKNGFKRMIGADFDEKNGKLYMLLEHIDHSQSRYEAAPVMIVYDLLKG
jgi:hypothetical protein